MPNRNEVTPSDPIWWVTLELVEIRLKLMKNTRLTWKFQLLIFSALIAEVDNLSTTLSLFIMYTYTIEWYNSKLLSIFFRPIISGALLRNLLETIPFRETRATQPSQPFLSGTKPQPWSLLTFNRSSRTRVWPALPCRTSRHLSPSRHATKMRPPQTAIATIAAQHNATVHVSAQCVCKVRVRVEWSCVGAIRPTHWSFLAKILRYVRNGAKICKTRNTAARMTWRNEILRQLLGVFDSRAAGSAAKRLSKSGVGYFW